MRCIQVILMQFLLLQFESISINTIVVEMGGGRSEWQVNIAKLGSDLIKLPHTPSHKRESNVIIYSGSMCLSNHWWVR